MENNSGLLPLGRAVLVKYYDTPEKKESVIFIPETVQERQMMLEQRAVVVAIGAACWPDEPPRARPGDKVLIAKMAGYPAKGVKDGEQYRLVNDRDIFAKVMDEGV